AAASGAVATRRALTGVVDVRAEALLFGLALRLHARPRQVLARIGRHVRTAGERGAGQAQGERTPGPRPRGATVSAARASAAARMGSESGHGASSCNKAASGVKNARAACFNQGCSSRERAASG